MATANGLGHLAQGGPSLGNGDAFIREAIEGNGPLAPGGVNRGTRRGERTHPRGD